MPFDTALTSGNYDSLRGTASVAKRYEAGVYLSVNANTEIYAGRVNMASPLAPVYDVTYDGASGTLANVRVGMTVLFAATNDKTAAYFRGFVRKTPTATILYVNESGESAPMADNDYFWVLNDFAVFEILPREVAGAPVPGVDTAFRRLKPIIGNLKSCYADFVDSVTSKYTLALAPTVAAADNDATGAITYLWEVPSGVTITVGASTDKDVTIACDPGEYWVHFTATDSNSVPNTFHLKIWAHSDASPPAPLQVGELEVTANIPTDPNAGASEGHSASVAAFAGVSAILDNTLVCAWADQRYNGTAEDLGSTGNILMVGRFRSEANTTDYDPDTGQQDARVTFPIEGALQQLVRRFPAMEITNNAAPDAFNEVEDLTVWRAVWLILSEYSTFGSLHSLKLDDTTENFLYKAGFRLQGGDLLYCVADLLQGITSALQDNAAGMCEIARRGTLLPTADRAGMTGVADFDPQDYEGLEYSRDYVDPIGLVKGDGGGYNSTIDDVSAYLARAPKGAPASGAGEGQLPRQVLIANQSITNERSELAVRLGHAYAAQQTPEMLTMRMPAGYWFLTPDVKARYTWTLAASETVRGRAQTTAEKWQLMSRTNRVVDPGQGTIETTCVFVRETSGAAGQIDDFPPLDLGAYGFGIGELPDFIVPPPTSDGSGSLDGTDFSIDEGTLDGTTIDSACVGNQSKVTGYANLPDILTIKSITVTYSATATLAAPVNRLLIRTTGQAGQIIGQWTTQAGSGVTYTWTGTATGNQIGVEMWFDASGCEDTGSLISITYTTVEQAWEHTIDLTASNGNFAVEAASFWNPASNGTYAAGQGWQTTQSAFVSIPANTAARLQTKLDFGMTVHLLSATITMNVASGYATNGGGTYVPPHGANQSPSDQLLTQAGWPVGSSSLTWNGDRFITSIGIYWEGDSGAADDPLTTYATRLHLRGLGPNPFGA